jgi:HEAT repeat protein
MKVRTGAVRALGELGTPKAKAALVEILEKKEN